MRLCLTGVLDVVVSGFTSGPTISSVSNFPATYLAFPFQIQFLDDHQHHLRNLFQRAPSCALLLTMGKVANAFLWKRRGFMTGRRSPISVNEIEHSRDLHIGIEKRRDYRARNLCGVETGSKQ